MKTRFLIFLKHNAFLLCLLASLINPLFAQLIETEKLDTVNLIITYNLSFRPDTNDLANVREEKMSLIVGNQISLFASYNRLINDSLLMGLNERADLNQITAAAMAGRASTRFNFYITKNHNKNQMIFDDQIFNEYYTYLEPLKEIRWELTDYKDELLGYEVQKAVAYYGGRRWEAWFTHQIPISDGPYKFNGLPGLILKIYDSENHYVFLAESLAKKQEERVFGRKIQNRINLTKKEFFIVQHNAAENLILQMREWGNPVEVINRLEENLRRRNNPIELTAD